jgi:hypothetical protein
MCQLSSAGDLLIKCHLLLVYSLEKFIELYRIIFIINQLRPSLTPNSGIEIRALFILGSGVD